MLPYKRDKIVCEGLVFIIINWFIYVILIVLLNNSPFALFQFPFTPKSYVIRTLSNLLCQLEPAQNHAPAGALLLLQIQDLSFDCLLKLDKGEKAAKYILTCKTLSHRSIIPCS